MRASERTVHTVAVVALAVGVVAVIGLIRALGDLIYFEPTDAALVQARAGAHAARSWSIVLVVAGFVAAVVTDRTTPLLNVFLGISVLFMAANAFLLAAVAVAVGLTDVALIVVVLVRAGSRAGG